MTAYAMWEPLVSVTTTSSPVLTNPTVQVIDPVIPLPGTSTSNGWTTEIQYNLSDPIIPMSTAGPSVWSDTAAQLTYNFYEIGVPNKTIGAIVDRGFFPPLFGLPSEEVYGSQALLYYMRARVVGLGYVYWVTADPKVTPNKTLPDSTGPFLDVTIVGLR